MYKVELLAGERDKDDNKTMAESYVRTALELRDMGELAFFGRFSGETARVLTCFPSLSADDVGRRVFNLHQRHARAIGDVLETGVERHSAQFVNRSLPPSSLLMMTVLPGAAPALATTGKRGDSVQAWIDEAEAAPDLASAGSVTPERSQRHRGRSQPAFERARGVINELFPNGVPGQAAEPNSNLCRRVGEKLKQDGLPGVSDDTILMAESERFCMMPLRIRAAQKHWKTSGCGSAMPWSKSFPIARMPGPSRSRTGDRERKLISLSCQRSPRNPCSSRLPIRPTMPKPYFLTIASWASRSGSGSTVALRARGGITAL
jgi:hypothetical protein